MLNDHRGFDGFGKRAVRCAAVSIQHCPSLLGGFVERSGRSPAQSHSGTAGNHAQYIGSLIDGAERGVKTMRTLTIEVSEDGLSADEVLECRNLPLPDEYPVYRRLTGGKRVLFTCVKPFHVSIRRVRIRGLVD